MLAAVSNRCSKNGLFMRCIAAFLRGKSLLLGNWSKEVYYEQGESRGISIKDYAPWRAD
ncbi:MAG: hypothetical protein ACJ72U_14150 [Nitrososphaeraceae archaeon]